MEPSSTYVVPGDVPGTVDSDPEARPTTIRVIAYGPDALRDVAVTSVDEIAALCGKYPVIWVNVDGLRDAHLISQIGELFKIHPLTLEDMVHRHQRPKVEQYDEYLFAVVRMADEPPSAAPGEASDSDEVYWEQVSVLWGDKFVITVQERPGDCLKPVRRRIFDNLGRVRRMGADYLGYSVIDAVVDHYFPILDTFGERIDRLENQAISRPARQLAPRIYTIKQQLLLMRRAVWPLREALSTLAREESPHVSREVQVFFRDALDHCARLMEILELNREMTSGLMDLYMSQVSHRMNEVMKVLTIIATIFIPLSFIAGVYGMNFDTSSPWNMPELLWRHGYPFALGLMAVVALGLVWFMWRRGWLTRDDIDVRRRRGDPW